MNENPENKIQQRRIRDLVGGLCNNTLLEAEHQELTELLDADPDARRYYLDYMLVHVKLMEKAAIDTYAFSCDASPAPTNESPADVELAEVEESKNRSHNTTSRRSLSSWLPLLAAIAAMVGFVLAYPTFESTPGEEESLVVEAADPDSSPDADKPVRQEADLPLYVAQLGGVSPDVRWATESKSHEFLLRVRRGDRLVLQQGLVEIDYFSGASIILRGPCEFVATGESSGRLLSGQLTGQVGRGDFVLTTPTAEVIDLGTEFGVALDSDGNTEVCVLDGEVRVSDSPESSKLSDSRLLTEGMAVRIARGSGITAISDALPERFVRMLPSEITELSETGELSLVGILNGLRHGRFRLAGVIAADTGESDQHPWLRDNGPGHSLSNGYQTTAWHPFVDGVFIPDELGSAVVIDSAKHAVDLPQTMGRTWGPLWSRSRLSQHVQGDTKVDFWGSGTLEVVVEQLDQCQTGMIGMHANVGVTFDLQSIRQHWNKTPSEFSAIVRNLDNSMERVPHWSVQNRFSASLRVFVDGELRDSRIDFTRADGEHVVQTELSPSDRFLTFVSTDAGEFITNPKRSKYDGFDHVVLIDPVLKLSQ